jgi:hypothetical protein
MMRRTAALLTTVATLLLALVPAAEARAGQPPAHAAGALPPRHTALVLDPAPSDLELAELEFSRRRSQRISATTLRVAVHGLFGADYLAIATPRRRPHGELVALVLLVNRPTALADPASIRVSVRASRSLGRISTLRLRNPFTSHGTGAIAGPTDLRCRIPRAGRSLEASDLRQVGLPRGAKLTGFGVTAAIAAAYDVSCALAYPSALRQAVQGPGNTGCGSGAIPQGTLCCPPNAICAPAPTPEPVPPSPVPPACPPCNPRPGYACPLIAQPTICPAVARAARRLAPAAPY